MLDTVNVLVADASRKLGLDEKTVEGLLVADAEHAFDIELDNGKSFKAYRVQHNHKNGPYKGGLRFHENVDLDEVRALSILMSLKTAAAGLPLGGGKGGVAVNPRELSETELEELSRKYVRHLHKHIGPDKDVPAPDVNTNAATMDWMVDEYEKLTGDTTHASFTGKSIGKGGSLGRDAATGRGGVIALQELLKLQAKPHRKLTFAVQGFGNVGHFFALTAQQEEPDWQLVAASDTSAAIYSEEGLNAKELAKIKQGRGRFSDLRKDNLQLLKPDEIITLDVDVLVLAALEDSVNETNMKGIKAKYIIEMANGPINADAYRYLLKKDVTILPDIIANAGGVIVSYLEWHQNKIGEQWTEDKVNQELKKYMVDAVKTMYEISKSEHVPLKEAGIIAALKRLL